MPKKVRFLQVDVFTDRPFGGNPLAVFPDAAGLTAGEMQQLAREMNLSETTFVLPPEAPGADFRVRIFTPARELPFAGHPVVGTHWVLAHLGRVDLHEPVTRVHLELGVGVLPADLHVVDGRVHRVVMTHDRPRSLATVDDVAPLAEGFGLSPAAIEATGLPAQVVSTGLPQMIVPVRSLAEVQGLDPGGFDVAALARVWRAAGTDMALLFSLEVEQPGVDAHVRVFAPLHGIPEDPATGSATGALGAYLVHHQAVAVVEPVTYLATEQGLEIGRPSRLMIEVDVSGGDAAGVRVGGQVVLIADGEVRF